MTLSSAALQNGHFMAEEPKDRSEQNPLSFDTAQAEEGDQNTQMIAIHIESDLLHLGVVGILSNKILYCNAQITSRCRSERRSDPEALRGRPPR